MTRKYECKDYGCEQNECFSSSDDDDENENPDEVDGYEVDDSGCANAGIHCHMLPQVEQLIFLSTFTPF